MRPSAMDGRGLKPGFCRSLDIFTRVRPSAMDGRGLKPSFFLYHIRDIECARPPWTGED